MVSTLTMMRGRFLYGRQWNVAQKCSWMTRLLRFASGTCSCALANFMMMPCLFIILSWRGQYSLSQWMCVIVKSAFDLIASTRSSALMSREGCHSTVRYWMFLKTVVKNGIPLIFIVSMHIATCCCSQRISSRTSISSDTMGIGFTRVVLPLRCPISVPKIFLQYKCCPMWPDCSLLHSCKWLP